MVLLFPHPHPPLFWLTRMFFSKRRWVSPPPCQKVGPLFFFFLRPFFLFGRILGDPPHTYLDSPLFLTLFSLLYSPVRSIFSFGFESFPIFTFLYIFRLSPHFPYRVFFPTPGPFPPRPSVFWSPQQSLDWVSPPTMNQPIFPQSLLCVTPCWWHFPLPPPPPV